jgi:hypothetical protein
MSQTTHKSRAEVAASFDDQDEEFNLKTYGKPPYWFIDDVPPRYDHFKIHWKDAEQREYMFLEKEKYGIRIPIAVNRQHTLDFPQSGDEIVLTEYGGGNQHKIRIVDLIMWKNFKNTAAATIEFK